MVRASLWLLVAAAACSGGQIVPSPEDASGGQRGQRNTGGVIPTVVLFGGYPGIGSAPAISGGSASSSGGRGTGGSSSGGRSVGGTGGSSIGGGGGGGDQTTDYSGLCLSGDCSDGYDNRSRQIATDAGALWLICNNTCVGGSWNCSCGSTYNP